METTVKIDIDAPVPMRDGTVLRANIYQTASEEPQPVLLTRLPYGKDLVLGTGFLDPVRAAQSGYIVVVQDVRGRFRSEGEFEPFTHEFEDGYDTVEWCARLPGCNGQVGMFGASYFGMTQWQAALENPPHLKALFPAISWGNYFNGTLMRGGAYEWGLWSHWVTDTLAVDGVVRKWRHNPLQLRAAIMELVGKMDTLVDEGYQILPLKDMKGLEDAAPYFTRMLAEPPQSLYWAHLNLTGRFDQVQVPVYLLGGWFDIFLGETLNIYRELKNAHPDPSDPNAPRLIIGPWTHGFPGNIVGDRDFGIAASGLFINYREDLTGLQLRWFNAVLQEKDREILKGPPVQIFVMGENRWRFYSDWPLPNAQMLDLYLASNGHANSRQGDGMLALSKPSHSTPDHYLYDPENPVPTLGGALLMPGLFPPGPKEQAPVESREDVLTFTTEPLEADITVIGAVSVTVFVSSSAPDTDFVARLTDVFPDGQSYNLTDGIIRASYRDANWAVPNAIRPQTMEPDRIYALTIDMWATANTFARGHRIRLDLTSSNFPRWDRNLNTGNSGADSSEMSTALQTVYHDKDHPSVLHLFQVPGMDEA